MDMIVEMNIRENQVKGSYKLISISHETTNFLRIFQNSSKETCYSYRSCTIFAISIKFVTNNSEILYDYRTESISSEVIRTKRNVTYHHEISVNR